MTYSEIYDKLMFSYNLGYVNKEYIISKSKNIVDKQNREVNVAYKAMVIKHEVSQYVARRRERINTRITKAKNIFK